jgi:hypothetical protein
MHWVDHLTYFGPDRRKGRGGMRLRERRQEDYAGRLPCLRTGLRQLRMRVLEAHGQAGMAAFIARVNGLSTLALAHGEREAASMLTSLAAGLARAGQRDARQAIYEYLDRVCAKLTGAA